MTRNELETELDGPVDIAARRLLGAILERRIGDTILRGRIVEVEAYHQNDPASHSVTGPTGRAKTMFGPAGFLYVYFTYGMHYCCNVTLGKSGEGAGALIRAVEPLDGYDAMVQNRNGKAGRLVTNGPGKICQAFTIDRSFDGHDLAQKPITLQLMEPLDDDEIVISKRIGIAKAVDTMWRFYIKDNPYVSKK